MKFGQYELLERIAIGGMAEVYKGRVVGAEGFEKLVAIKRIQPDLIADERFVTMLLTEARIHSALSHRNIVQIHDLGISEEGEYFIVLEYVEGYDLRAIMESITADGEIIPEALSLHIAAEVAQGLHFAHDLRGPDRQPLGLIHRDVSPSNVLISFAGEVKLSDFGLAKRRHDRSVVGSLKGNLIYMSPEQARQAPLDRRTDVFSLGALLFELLTGKRMREITDEIRGWGEVAAGVVRSARSVRPDLPPSFEALLNQALAAEPSRRFPDAGTFGAAIRQLLAQMNTPVGPADLQALLSVVRPPKKPRGELDRSKVIRLGPEGSKARSGVPVGAAPAQQTNTGVGPSPVERLRAKQGVASPGGASGASSSPSFARRAAPPAPAAASKPPDDMDSFPPTPPPIGAALAAPARRGPGPSLSSEKQNSIQGANPGASPRRSPVDSPHNTWAGGFSLAPSTAPAPAPARARSPVAPSTLPGFPPAASAPAAPPPASIDARHAPTPPATTAPGSLGLRSRNSLAARHPPRALSPGPDIATVETPAPTPGPTPPPPAGSPIDWSTRPTPPPTAPASGSGPVPGSWAPSGAAPGSSPATASPSEPAVTSSRESAPSAPTWQPVQSLQPFEDFPPPRVSRPVLLPILPIGLWRWVAVGAAGLLVLIAFIVHVGVVPLEVLVAWKKPAQLYLASEPEGGIAKLDGIRLIDPTPSKIPVTRDRVDHVIEIEYPGYRPAREIVRFDRSVALSFMLTLEKEGDEPILPVSSRPSSVERQRAPAGPAVPSSGAP
jgi:eukaryotic-like serine/threonine-protein kinase